jgi:hypothetical protein
MIPLRDFGKRFLLFILLALLLFAIFTYGLVVCGLIWTFIKDFSFVFLIITASIGVLWINAIIKKRADYP